MCKKLIRLYLIFFCFTCCFGQLKSKNEKSIIIYSDDKGYMQPFIEKTIENLKNTETDKRYFNSVNSFNRFISDNKYQAELNDLILTQKPSNIKLNPYYSDAEKQIRERIFNILKGYNYFLTVKTNTLGELIEFQFQLFETINSDNSSYNISDKVLSVENFFINPKEKGYTQEITNAIQRLFLKSNKIPEAELKIYNKVFSAKTFDNEIILPLNSKIILDGSNSGDNDTETITYHWRNIISRDQKYQTTKKIAFTENSSIQEILIKDPGVYQIGFKVFDGIEYSKEVSLTIKVKYTPKIIELIDSVSYSKRQKTFFLKKEKNNFLAKLYIINFSRDSLKNSVILSKESINQKTINDVDKKLLIKPLTVKQEKLFYYSYLEFNPGYSDAEISEKKIYYLYTVDDDGNLHDEKIIKHLYLARGAFNFRIKYIFGATSFLRENDQNQDDKDSQSYNNITGSVGILLTNNLELELTFPLAKLNEISYNGYTFSYPYSAGISLNHLFFNPQKKVFGDLIPFIGCSLKSYNLRSDNDKKFDRTFSLAPQFGVEYNFKSWRLFDLALRYDFNYDFFTNSTFKKIRNSSMSFGVVLKI